MRERANTIRTGLPFCLAEALMTRQNEYGVDKKMLKNSFLCIDEMSLNKDPRRTLTRPKDFYNWTFSTHSFVHNSEDFSLIIIVQKYFSPLYPQELGTVRLEKARPASEQTSKTSCWKTQRALDPSGHKPSSQLGTIVYTSRMENKITPFITCH